MCALKFDQDFSAAAAGAACSLAICPSAAGCECRASQRERKQQANASCLEVLRRNGCWVAFALLCFEHFYGHFVEAWDVEEDGLWSLQLTTLFGNLKEYRCYWDSCCRDVSSLLWQPVYDTLLGLYFMNNWKYYHKMLLRDSNIGISFWNVQYPVNIPQSDIRVERCRLLSWLEQDPPHCHVDCAGQCTAFLNGRWHPCQVFWPVAWIFQRGLTGKGFACIKGFGLE